MTVSQGKYLAKNTEGTDETVSPFSMGSPKAAQHNQYIISAASLSILSFSNFLLSFLWNIPSCKREDPVVL